MKGIVLMLALLAAGAAAGEDGELSRPAAKLLDSALRTAQGSRVQDRQREKLVEEAKALPEEELLAVVRRVRAETGVLKSLPEIRALLERVYVTRGYGEVVAERMPDLLDRMEEDAAEVRMKLLADALRLEDLRLARAVLLRDAGAAVPEVRARVVLAAGGFLVWGEAVPDAAGILFALLEDEDPGVRVAAIRAGFLARFDPVFPWAVAHLDDPSEGTFQLDEEAAGRGPGEEALERILEVTRLDLELTWEAFHALGEEEKGPLRALFTSWWTEGGERFPLAPKREGSFRPTPASTETAILEQGETTASFQLWAGLDRTRIRVSVEEIELFATSPYDWRVHFHLRYMAQGMRADDGESFVRHHPVTSAYNLARKAIGCYVLSFQPLHDGKLKVRLVFYDPIR